MADSGINDEAHVSRSPAVAAADSVEAASTYRGGDRANNNGAERGGTEAATAIGSDDDDDDDPNRQMYRGNLLELAQFLTMFRSYYGWDEDESSKEGLLEASVVTPNDIENGFKYRYLLRSQQGLLDEKFTLEAHQLNVEESGGGGENESTDAADRWKDVEARLAKSDKRGEQIHRLLQRFEVWSTKDLAHTLFMPSCDCQDLDEASTACWSKLLHIPGAAYFADRLPTPRNADDDNGHTSNSGSEPTLVQERAKQKSQPSKTKVPTTEFSKVYHKAHVAPAGHPLCSLIMPPNVHTWEEYARIAEMVSSLHTEEARKAAADSPCSGALKTMRSMCTSVSSPTNGAAAKKSSIYASEYNFLAHDLVALWVRGQRDTVAVRHLMQLFTCRQQRGEPIESNGNGKIPTFKLTFEGNHKSTKRRVLAESALVDKLVEWAVLNHVLFHYHFVRHQPDFKGGANGKASRMAKRTSTGGSKDSPSRSTKRLRTEEGTATYQPPPWDAEANMLEACYRFILRWFCRRNQEKVAILYFTNQALFEVVTARHYGCEEDFAFWKKCVDANIPEAISERLKLYASKSNGEVLRDRSFARLERQIRKGAYRAGNKFYLAVSSLLRAFSECVAEEQSIHIEPGELNFVVEDFELMYTNFYTVLQDEGIHAAAATLLDLDGQTYEMSVVENRDGESIRNLLLGTHAPWNELCAQCRKGCREHETQSGYTLFCTSCETAYHEDCYDPANFQQHKIKELIRESNQSVFFSLEVPESDLRPDFCGSRASMVQWTELTLTLVRTVEENGNMESSGLSLRQTEASYEAMEYIKAGSLTLQDLGRDLEEEYPIALEEALTGCLVSKVIEIGAGYKAGIRKNDILVGVEFVSLDDGEGPSAEGIQWFAGLKKEDRLNLFKCKCKELKVVVMRPSLDILSRSRNFIREIRLHNLFLQNLSQESISICNGGKCQNGKQTTSDSGTEAERIRRDAINCRAIIRAIGMQSYSLGFHDDEVYPESVQQDKMVLVSLRRMDAMFSWIICDNQNPNEPTATTTQLLQNSFFNPFCKEERLSWAVGMEKNPELLLLTGMGVLLRRRGLPEEQLHAFTTHFIHKFCAWRQTVPPLSALMARPPWSQSCSGCQFRAGETFRRGRLVCASCLRQVEKAGEVGKVPTYDRSAEIIGTSIFLVAEDPLIRIVKREAKLRFDSFGRPVEFVVAFYFPPMHRKEEGVFLLFPVFSQVQLQYLLDRCSILSKQPEDFSSRESLDQWIKGSILSLPGVLKLSSSALEAKIEESSAFIDAVGAEIALCAQQTGAAPHSEDLSAVKNCVILPRASLPAALKSPRNVFEYLNGSADQCSRLLRCLLHSPTPTVRLMIETLEKSRHANCTDLAPRDQSYDNDLCNEICRWSGQRKIQEEESKTQEGQPIRLEEANFCIPKAIGQQFTFKLVYTDLYGDSEKERKSLEELLTRSRQMLVFPGNRCLSSDRAFVVLSRVGATSARGSNNDDPHLSEYQGVGWGMELIIWNNDGRLRVGRVHPKSPAARAGLKTHDSILEINGRPIKYRGSTWTHPFLAAALLSAGLLSCRSAQTKSSVPKIMISALETIRGPVSGPIVLQVRRTQPGARNMAPVAPSPIQVAVNPIRTGPRQNAGGAVSNAFQASAGVASDISTNEAEMGNSRDQLKQRIRDEALRRRTDRLQRRILGDAGMAALGRLSNAVRLDRRPPLKAVDFYVACCCPDTVLTLIEASVLLEAVQRGMPMMGLRLLCPRYSLSVAAQQMIVLASQPDYLNKIPRLRKGLWEVVLRSDLKRYEKEKIEEPEAPDIFLDKVVACPYGLPTDKLPVDRIVEDAFRRNLANQRNAEAQQPEPAAAAVGRAAAIAAAGIHNSAGVGNGEARWEVPATQYHPQQLGYPRDPAPQAQSPYPATTDFASAPLPYYPGIQNRPHPPNNYEAGQGPLLQTYPVNGHDPTERIRGGGEPLPTEADGLSLVDGGTSLYSLPVSKWNNQLVSSECETEEGGKERGVEEFLGYVQMPEELPPSAAGIEEVRVALFYGRHRGVFAVTKVNNLDPDDLKIVKKDSDKGRMAERIEQEFRVLEKLKATAKKSGCVGQKEGQAGAELAEKPGGTGGDESQVGKQQDTQQNAPSRGAPEPAILDASESKQVSGDQQSNGQLRDPNYARDPGDDSNSSKWSSKFAEASAELVHRLLGQMEPLGHFVDGRTVLWLPSDPHALYIEELSLEHSSSTVAGKRFRDGLARENRVRNSEDRLISSSDAKHCCLWGCTFKAEDSDRGFELCQFPSIPHLHRHNSTFHSFCGEAENSVRLGGLPSFARVGSRDGLKRLVAGLTSAACARSARLAEIAKKTTATVCVDPSGDKIVCSPSRYAFHLSIDDLFETLENLSNKDPMRRGVMLLFKIALLFDVEDGLSVRMSPGAEKALRSIVPRDGLNNAKSCGRIPSIQNRECLECSLCTLDCEEVLQVLTIEGANDRNSGEAEPIEQPNYRGIGCAIAGNIFFPGPDDVGNKHGGFLGNAKRLLLRIAQKIPPQLQQNDSVEDNNGTLGELCTLMWQADGGGRDFRQFVMLSSSVPMLAQAFVALLASFQREELPSWWSGEAGWSSGAILLLSRSSKASLMLHLLLCDIALAEYLETAPEQTPLRNLDLTGVSSLPPSFKDITAEARIRLLLETADKMSIAGFTGSHEYFCSICDDGGSLLCCEFCPGVMHRACCSPPVKELDHWCCASCTASLLELRSSFPQGH